MHFFFLELDVTLKEDAANISICLNGAVADAVSYASMYLGHYLKKLLAHTGITRRRLSYRLDEHIKVVLDDQRR